jgi:hypothetical protein
MGYQDSVYSFWKVEDYFSDYTGWNYLQDITSFKFHDEKDPQGHRINSLEVNATGALDGKPYVLEIEFWSPSVFRVCTSFFCTK